MHADINDAASELEELERNVALANRKKPEMTFTGRCYYCESTLSKGCFCDTDCREDFEKVERARKMRNVA